MTLAKGLEKQNVSIISKNEVQVTLEQYGGNPVYLVLSLHFMCSTSTLSVSTDQVKHWHTSGHMFFKGQLWLPVPISLSDCKLHEGRWYKSFIWEESDELRKKKKLVFKQHLYIEILGFIELRRWNWSYFQPVNDKMKTWSN